MKRKLDRIERRDRALSWVIFACFLGVFLSPVIAAWCK